MRTDAKDKKRREKTATASISTSPCCQVLPWMRMGEPRHRLLHRLSLENDNNTRSLLPSAILWCAQTNCALQHSPQKRSQEQRADRFTLSQMAKFT